MKQLNRWKTRSRTLAVSCLATWIVFGVTLALCYAAPGSDSTNSVPGQKNAPKAEKKLTGAELYAINCNRCHAERYPTEFTSAQWKTIMTHMRIRANLPAKQAREILKYMQEESGS